MKESQAFLRIKKYYIEIERMEEKIKILHQPSYVSYRNKLIKLIAVRHTTINQLLQKYFFTNREYWVKLIKNSIKR